MERLEKNILYSKYRVNNFQINPEYYSVNRYSISSNNLIRCLVLFEHPTISPLIYTDTINNVLDKIIPKDSLQKIYLNQHFHMYVGKNAEKKLLFENLNATHLIRHYFSTFYGFNSTEIVYGPTVLCGSFNPSTLHRDGYDYSTPYEVVEQCLRIHEINRL
jgi:hypothetical protein